MQYIHTYIQIRYPIYLQAISHFYLSFHIVHGQCLLYCPIPLSACLSAFSTGLFFFWLLFTVLRLARLSAVSLYVLPPGSSGLQATYLLLSAQRVSYVNSTIYLFYMYLCTQFKVQWTITMTPRFKASCTFGAVYLFIIAPWDLYYRTNNERGTCERIQVANS